jgi:hypothetical protein
MPTMSAWLQPKSFKPKKGDNSMNLDYEKNYQHLLDQVTQQLEILMMEILLASINRLKYNYENATLKLDQETDDSDF